MSKLIYLSLFTLRLSVSTAQQLVKDINPGPSSSIPQQLITIGKTVYFVATDATHGQELWKTDGTEFGTVIIKDLSPGSVSSQIQNLINLNGTLYFSAVSTLPSQEKRQLWKSDGTEAGTVELDDGHKDGEVYDVIGPTKVGTTLFYMKRSSLGGSDNWMLYKAEAGSAATTLVYTLAPYQPTSPILAEANGILYISYANNLLKSDPQSPGTSPTLVKAGGVGANLTSYQKALYFTVGTSASELWTTQGTPATTQPIMTGKGPIRALKSAGEYLFFTAGQNGRDLWVSRGDVPSTKLIQTFAVQPGNLTSIFADFTIMGRTPVYFTVGQDGKLYYTLGYKVTTATGTFTGPLHNLISLQNTLYFMASNGLYRIQGNITQTAPILQTQGFLTSLAALDDALLLGGNLSISTGTELYQLTPAK